MSRYVVLIKARLIPDSVDFGTYALTISNNPAIGLISLQSYCPTNLELIHTIEAGTRTEDLERTLHIKYEKQRLRPRSFWFILTPEDVAFIQTINENNLTRISGFIKRALAPPPPPVIATEKLPDFITEQLELCNNLLK